MGTATDHLRSYDTALAGGGFGSPLRRPRVALPLPTSLQILVALSALALTAISVIVTGLPWLGGVVILTVYAMVRVMNNPFYSLLTFLFVLFAVLLQPEREGGGASMIDVAAGSAMLGIFIWWFFNLKVLNRAQFAINRAHLVILWYFAWSIFIGIGGMITYNNTLNDWFREILIQLPLVIIPFLVVRALEGNEGRQKILFKLLPIFWTIIIIIALIQFRSHVLKAVYFYQAGRVIFGVTSCILLFFTTVCFVVNERRPERIKYYSLVAAFAAVPIGLSMYRTVWVACLVALAVIYTLASREERRRLRRYVWILSGLLLAGLAIAYLRVPLVRLFVTGFFARFSSTAKVTTDASLVNRYIEWQWLLKAIEGSPLVGYGYGAHYLDYDWLRGYWLWAGYSHNAYLFLLFKGGVIGLVAILGAYFSFLFKAIRLSQARQLDPAARAAARVVLLWGIFLLITSLTLNAFAERESLFWVGLGWGLLIVYDRRLKSRSSEGSKQPRTESPEASLGLTTLPIAS